MKFLSLIKDLFKKKEEEKPDLSLGERDEQGFAPLLKNGKETNVKVMVWTKEEIIKCFGENNS